MRIIDGDALVVWLSKWMISSFGTEPTEETKAIKVVCDAVGDMVKELEREKKGGGLIRRQDAIDAMVAEVDRIIDNICIQNVTEARLRDAVNRLPSAEPKIDDENELKFYYVESLDDYWVGRRLDNFYYANWHEGLGFVWSHSRYLPWGEHIVDENTLWKEHTYPSEPIEIPFTEWIVGFVKKYFAEPKTGHWILSDEQCQEDVDNGNYHFVCSECGKTDVHSKAVTVSYCWNCGARMRSEEK